MKDILMSLIPYKGEERERDGAIAIFHTTQCVLEL